MTNYNEKITGAKNYEELKGIIDNINTDIRDNQEVKFDVIKLDKALEVLNKEYKTDYSAKFIADLEVDRKTAFENLVKTHIFDRLTYSFNENGTIKFEKKTALFKFSDLESAYQIYKSTENDKNGKPIKNKSVTVFGALRFESLVNAFIRNLFITNLTIDKENAIDLSRVKIADKTIFDKNDGECFASTSNNALEKQLNILVKFFNLDVKMLKKDLPILKLSAQKIKRDIKDNKSSINEVKYLKFVDVIFSVVTSRYNNENVKIYTNDGEEVNEVKTETAETVTETVA